jgi:hypothetical protein
VLELITRVDFRLGMEIISDVWRCHRRTACGQYRKSRENSKDTRTIRDQAPPLSRSLQSQRQALWAGLRFAWPSKGHLGPKMVNRRCFKKSETTEPIIPDSGVRELHTGRTRPRISYCLDSEGRSESATLTCCWLGPQEVSFHATRTAPKSDPAPCPLPL